MGDSGLNFKLSGVDPVPRVTTGGCWTSSTTSLDPSGASSGSSFCAFTSRARCSSRRLRIARCHSHAVAYGVRTSLRS